LHKLVSGEWPSFRELAGPRQEELVLLKMEEFGIDDCLAAPCWEPISDQCKRLVKAMLAISPRDRISPAQILAHPWISGGDAPSVPLTKALEGLKELHLAELQKVRSGGRRRFEERDKW
jgi:serine/threonine protein kinase